MATSTASIGGLVSGLDTATIVDQLMSVEAQPQTQLKTRLTQQQTKVKTLQDLNAKIAALGTTAKALTTSGSLTPLKASSSSTAVTATATTGTAAGTLDLTVVQTAAVHKLTFATTAKAGDHVTGATNDVVLGRPDGTTTTLTSDGTLAGLVAAINAAGTGVRATTVRLDDGTQRLVVSSSTSGAAGAFTLTGSDGADLLGGATVAQGRDAAITIGTDTIHSATNTFAGVVPGLSITVSQAAVGAGPVTVDVGSDPDALAKSVKGLVDAVNATLSQIDTLTAFDSSGKATGVLAGDPAVISLRTALLNAVYPPDGTSLSTMGVQTDRSGKLVLDTTKLQAAYAKDPAAVQAALGAGLAGRISTQAKSASDTYTGTLTAAITGQNTSIRDLQDRIADWDTRLELRRATLNQQFTSLETALSNMKSQSSWLSSQIGSLPSSS